MAADVRCPCFRGNQRSGRWCRHDSVRPGFVALDWAHEPAFFSTEAAAARYGVQH